MPNMEMDDLMDMIVADSSPADISDKIKDILFAKASERVDVARPIVANTILNPPSDVE
jgi:hypothetical protein